MTQQDERHDMYVRGVFKAKAMWAAGQHRTPALNILWINASALLLLQLPDA